MKRIFLVVILLSQLLLGCLRAEARRQPVAAPQKSVTQQLSDLFQPLKIAVTDASLNSPDNTGTREVRIKWTAAGFSAAANSPDIAPKPGPMPSGSFAISADRKYTEPPQRQRTLDLELGRLLIAGIDRSGRLKSWTVMLDPRLVRSEVPGAGGTLTGQTLHLDQVEFFVSLPDDPEIVELRVYEPQSDRGGFKLSSLGSVTLRR